MRVLHLIDSGGLYGAEMMLLHLMQAQQELGLEPVLGSIGARGEGEKAIEREAGRRNLRVERFRMRPGPNWAGALKILAFARREQVQLMHSHGYKGNILLGLLPYPLRRLPVVSTVHGWTSAGGWDRLRLYEWLDALSLRFVDRVVFVSEAMRHHPRLRSLPSAKVAVIANGIPVESDQQENGAVREEIVRFAGQGFSIGAVGRLSPEKGLEHLVDAVADLVGEGRDVRLALLGEGELRRELEQRAADRGIGDRVLFAGYVPDARRYLPSFDLFCMPSLTEGLPLALLEAMATEVPIIASGVGGIPEALDQGRAGLLVAPGRVAALREAMATVLDEPQQAAARARQARQRLAAVYSSQAMAERYLQVYRQCRPGIGRDGGVDSRP